jgi:hyaluronoglucosaminidase
MTENETAPLGVIEGFYGKPWSDAARAGTAEFLRAQGYSFYVYAPKADRYLRRRWRDPIPPDELAALKALSSKFRAAGLQFGVGMTPYEIHLEYSPAERAALRRKIMQLNEVGVDVLCVLFDDMPGSFPGLAQLQSRVAADIGSWSDASRLAVCPTYYTDDPVLERVFGAAPKDYLQTLGQAMDPAIQLFWTGPKVCSSGYPDAHLEQVAQRLGRRPFIWDNHIANDGQVRSCHLYLQLSEEWSLNRSHISGAAINPMNQPNLSRMPLAQMAARFGVGTDLQERCDSALRAELSADLQLFQTQGIAHLGDGERARLRAKYQRLEPTDCAREIDAWLCGEYAFDPSCLTD